MFEEQIPQGQESLQETPRRQWTLWLAAGGCAIMLCAAVFIGSLIVAGPKFAQRFFYEKVQTADERFHQETQNNAMGAANAPVRVIEYGDFQCPYCLKFWNETEAQLIKEYVDTGKVYFEYRTYAVVGAESFSAAEGAYCAGDQNKFWEYHDTLFANWTGENVGNFTQDKLIRYAEALNLNMEEFTFCLSAGKHKATVEQDMKNAKTDGVNATPTFFINGTKMEGAHPFSTLKHFIDQALGENLDTQSG